MPPSRYRTNRNSHKQWNCGFLPSNKGVNIGQVLFYSALFTEKQKAKNPIYSIPFIAYDLAKVKEMTGPNWRIVFRCRISGTDKMKRFRHRVKKMASARDQMCYAKRICVDINHSALTLQRFLKKD